jgi:hypothetical protein
MMNMIAPTPIVRGSSIAFCSICIVFSVGALGGMSHGSALIYGRVSGGSKMISKTPSSF